MAQSKEMKLHDAARGGDISAVRLQLERGTNVNARDQYQNTPLHIAVYHGKIEAAAFLIQKGADVNAYNRYHETPLFYAASQGKKAAAELLLQNGAAVNARDNSKNTPLFFAVFQGKTEIVALLLQNGADVNAVNRQGETPLRWASSHGKKEIAEILVQKGAIIRSEKPVGIKSPEVKTTNPDEFASSTNTFRDSSTGMEFVFIRGGCFQMGSNQADMDEQPVHTVCISGFYMGKYEVTQGQWKKIMASNPSKFKNCGDSCPVENVSWYDAQEFIRRLNAKTGSAKYRLPSEEEWEYAARAGTEGQQYGDINNIAWYDKNSNQHTHEAGKKSPNAWGLYDMLGNVWEWVQDWYGYYSSDQLKNPTEPSSNLYRVARGGSWQSSAADTRAAFRNSRSPSERYFTMGFRLVAMN